MADETGYLALPELTPELQQRAALVQARRLSLQSQNQHLRLRYDEIMNWVNPPWDDRSRRVDPRPEQNNAQREGRAKIHTDWVSEAVMRWAVLQAGAPPTIRSVPRYVPPMPPPPPGLPPELVEEAVALYEIDRADAQNQASIMEAQTREWMDHADFDRWWLWTCWAKEAFGKAIARSGWDEDENMPTIELMENPSQVYYAWSSRYGRRRLAWVIVADEMSADEANFRYGLNIPTDEHGYVRWTEWSTGSEASDLDQRPEQSEEISRFIWVDESWDLTHNEQGETVVMSDFVVAGRVVDHQEYVGWPRLPFHVFENHHIPTYAHGKSTAEKVISLNEAYDDTLDRQHVVIEFESGPRYKGLNMGASDVMLEVPDPGNILPLREGEDVQQIDTRVDFWPAQVHTEELKQGLYFSTGLTTIAWGQSPNAQTSGRALNAEWMAVGLPLTGRLVEAGPVILDIIRNWWDYAESYVPAAKEVGQGWRRFHCVWEPLDIRDASERVMSVIQLYQADLMDPETALEKTGREDVPEAVALIKRYLQDPVWNPLRKQQQLVLRQLELQIAQLEMQTQAMMGQGQQLGPPGGGGEGPSPEELEQQGVNAATQQAQGPAGPVTEGQNQPGMAPGPAGLPLDVQTLSRTPLEQGAGNQIQLALGGAQGGVPTNGLEPR